MSPFQEHGSEWLREFDAKYSIVLGTVNNLRRQVEADHLSAHIQKEIRHKLAALDGAMELLTAKPQRRRGPAPGSKSGGQLP